MQYMGSDPMSGKSYHSVSFGIPDSNFSALNKDSLDYCMQMAELYNDKATEAISYDFLLSSVYSDSSIYFSHKVQEYLRDFKPEFIGWRVNHAYESTDSAGKVVGHNVIVLLDTAYQVKAVIK